ncbi:4-(cytidine 5'-diphospho)-2-C-methyl-D-erythritol kinase [uncultured Tateyamaria sp.]|uniref:4-(cytidine 5'-diphospho)-2-C-methyl-D-erythritol kinase n=1 Tax=Tateyamaria sp. 1078 TaxID=3417464 RepID=UPI002604F19C|nr:4-(cytidine 5'-diphospho)-2-C-methyl-D-erythritol kinase [uncultured Tateyamaria sp.]
MTTPEVFAPAKINLTLHVTGQRADGYHLLDSLVMFADVGDTLRLTPASQLSMSVTGPLSDGVPSDHRNLVWQAAIHARWTGHIDLEKHLPHGAGIGGGSSDAAALLRAANFAGDASALGADVPVCLHGRAARMSGIGEVIRPVDGLPQLHAVLVNPGVHVPTPRVFAALTHKDNPAMSTLPTAQTAGAFVQWLRDQRNDLEAPAVSAQPVIADVLKALTKVACGGVVRMSGSGATCFALFQNKGQAELAAKDLAGVHPDWWVRACALS